MLLPIRDAVNDKPSVWMLNWWKAQYRKEYKLNVFHECISFWFLGIPLPWNQCCSIWIHSFLILVFLSYQMITLPPFDSLDLIRTLRMAGFGMLVSGPSLHLWFNFLSKILPKRDVLTTFKKMFIGQTLYAPIMNAVFYSVNSALQGIDNFFSSSKIHKLKVYIYDMI